MDSADLGSLTGDQVTQLSSTQIRAIETADLAALSSDNLAEFSVSQVAAFTTQQVAAMSSEQIASLSQAQIAGMTTAELRALGTDDIHALTGDQVAAFTNTQIAALATDQVLALDTADLGMLSMSQASAFTATQTAAMHTDQLAALQAVSPIVLDLNGDGVHTLAAAEGVNFDLTGTGKTGQYGWVGSGDGLLVRDINHDGAINNGTELFGAATQLANGQRAGDGYRALAGIDGNHDGRINSGDAAFGELQVWVDANHDGKTDAGELKGLVNLGITELDLNYAVSGATDHGNIVGLVSGYKTADGQSHEMADVWFGKAPDGKAAPALHLDELLAAAPTDLVPVETPTAHAAVLPATPATPAADAPVASAPPQSGSSLEDELLRNHPPLV